MRPPACDVPAPEPCARCAGAGADPDPTDAPCTRCAGGRWEFARFDLPPSRTFELRRVRYEPRADGTGRLCVWLLAKRTGWRVAPPWVEYGVRETAPDAGRRSFLVDKLGTGRVHRVFLGAAAWCGCEGRTNRTSAKANRAARARGAPVYPTHGCVHLDALAALAAGGWLDLTNPQETNGWTR
ncbi:MAG TPA: hypothetical protein VGE74_22770 [Gemmata sp.]